MYQQRIFVILRSQEKVSQLFSQVDSSEKLKLAIKKSTLKGLNDVVVSG